ncbi:MAG: hypothetical protein NZ898_12845 [Myxococcota bacterium]|nr:hypothetical protein [Myxococcota bacterium]MDW8362831.1 hypothetical protein [Myxococcales bacterium]
MRPPLHDDEVDLPPLDGDCDEPTAPVFDTDVEEIDATEERLELEDAASEIDASDELEPWASEERRWTDGSEESGDAVDMSGGDPEAEDGHENGWLEDSGPYGDDGGTESDAVEEEEGSGPEPDSGAEGTFEDEGDQDRTGDDVSLPPLDEAGYDGDGEADEGPAEADEDEAPGREDEDEAPKEETGSRALARAPMREESPGERLPWCRSTSPDAREPDS